ncbi:methyltransferase domain-containing protein [Massilia arenosa]|uniref:Methyltransferase domain-containing protein n=1 Tax=Zemynaea arenosa TaxID=2561931 RepID=A0A4Y9SXH3_9BURK|nr:class I SAM-dependent methyltransferase [Massilia arenosa]TFW30237.1 methyltransferase domain-containing protein [Massilia arenosa]
MGWTEGYASDVEYVAGYYGEQGPDLLTFACLMNGIEPIDTSAPFNYCELGFGRGLTVSLLAAANPHARFYATDFNPAHVAGAQRLADRAGLANLTLLENSFEELAAGAVPDLPQFDFVTLHGIYTWVNAEVQQQILRFLNRYVKPGGIVYVSYNSMPGWASMAPLQRLLYEHAQLQVRKADQNVQSGVDFAVSLAQHKRGFFANNPALEARLQAVQKASPNYLVHEYMHPHWQPVYHMDLARQLAEAKLEYAGRAELALNYYRLFLPDTAVEQIDAVADSAFRETLKDYMSHTPFRKDVFVRGARRIGKHALGAWLNRFAIAPLTPPEKMTTEFKTAQGKVNGRQEVYQALFDALATGPKRLSELVGLPHFESAAAVVEAAALLADTQQAMVFQVRANPATQTAQAFNRILAQEARYSDELLGGFASPLTGSALPGGMFEMLVFDGLSQGVPPEGEQLGRHVAKVLRENGRVLRQEGVPVTDPDKAAELVRAGVAPILDAHLPRWRTHGIV